MTGITDPTQPYFKDGSWGWDGTEWRKLALLWGYSDTVSVVTSNLSASAGTNLLDTTAFAAGYAYVIQAVVGMNINTNPTEIRLLVISSGNYVPMIQVANPGADTPVLWTGQMTLKATDFLRARFKGCTLNDDIYIYVLGYKVALTE